MRIWNGLKKRFWGRSNQSNDDIISAHVCRVCDPRLLALKTGMDIRGQVWRSVGKRHFFWSASISLAKEVNSAKRVERQAPSIV